MKHLGIAAATLVLAAPAAAQLAPARINEIRIDQPGNDSDEYVELFGQPFTPVSNLTYVVIGDGTGGSGVVEVAVDLSGSIPASGFFVLAEGGFSLGPADQIATLNFENGDNVTHLLATGFTNAVGDDLDVDDDGVLDAPTFAIVDLVALVAEPNPPTSTELHYGPPSVGPAGGFVPAHVYRSPDGSASLSSLNVGAFDPAAADAKDTPGATNPGGAISVATGGTQVFALDFGPFAAGNLYLLVTGASGTSPGFPIGPIVLPVNADALAFFSLDNANGAVFQDTVGLLDLTGRAFPRLVVPPLGSSGLTLHSGAAVFNPSTLTPLLASNPVSLLLAP